MLRAPVPRPSRLVLAIGAAYTVILLAMTVTPVPGARANPFVGGAFHPDAWLSASTWSIGWPGEIVANVILFIPLGWLAARLLPLPLAVVAPILLSVAIEFSQLYLPGRVSDPRDLVANSVGALVGVVLASILARPRRQRQDEPVTR